MSSHRGYTLLEIACSMAVISIIIISLLNLVSLVLNNFEKHKVYSELYHSASISMNFLETQIRGAKKITVSSSKSGSLVSLTLKYITGDENTGKTEESIFRFDSSVKDPNNVHYHRFEYGDFNELARYISDVAISMKDNIVSIKITTDCKISQNGISIDSPIILYRDIYIKHVA